MTIKQAPGRPIDYIMEDPTLALAESLRRALEAPVPPGFEFGDLNVRLTTSDGKIYTFQNIDSCQIFPTCECGSDKVGSPRHSTWCPKHEEQG